MTHIPALTAASHVQDMAGKVCNEKLAFTLTGLSVALVAVMAARECMGLFREVNRHAEPRGHCR